MSIRVRLTFDEPIPGYSKKTWFLFDMTSCRVLADLEHLIQRKFDLQRNSSLNLYIDGFLLPAQEKIELVRDGDSISVSIQEKKKPKEIKTKKNNKIQDYSAQSEKKLKIQNDSINGKKSKQNDQAGKPCKTLTRKRAITSSSSESESSSESSSYLPLDLSALSSVEKKLRKYRRSFKNDCKRAKVGNFSKRNTKTDGEIYINPTNISSSSSSSSFSMSPFMSSSSSSSSLSEDSSNDGACIKKKKIPNRAKFPSASSSSSSSGLLLQSSSSSEDSSDDNHINGDLNTKDKEKYLHKNKGPGPKTKINKAATTSSSVVRGETVTNQSTKDDLNTSTSQKSINKSNKAKAKNNSTAAALLSDVPADQTTANQLKSQWNVDKNPQLGNTLLISRIPLPPEAVAGITNKTGSTIPRSINNSHIRFDSDGESEDVNHTCNLNSSVQNDGENSCDAVRNGKETTQVPLNSQEENGNCSSVSLPSQQAEASECHLINKSGVKGYGNGQMEKSTGQVAATKKTAVDYSSFPSLCGPPRCGDRIAYKVLELSASYTPEMSDYKEGEVLGYNPVTNEVSLELTEDSLLKPLGDGNISSKFELIYENEDENNDESRPPVSVIDRKVFVPWSSMVDPRLISA